MAKVVYKLNSPYWFDVLSSPPYATLNTDATVLEDDVADSLAIKLTNDTEEPHYSMNEAARSGNPSTPPPTP